MSVLDLALAMPFVAQAAASLLDEVLYHRRRGLPRWERIGHPLDTLTVIACYAWLALVPPSSAHAAAFVALAASSCLFVTKDEPLHASRCSPGEHWVHALLFVLHPVALGVAGWLWWTSRLRGLVLAQLAVVSAFGAYQLLYWNGPWNRRRSAAR
jgi:hypothetical protein